MLQSPHHGVAVPRGFEWAGAVRYSKNGLNGYLSRSEISRAVGQRKVSGQLNVVLKELLERGAIAYTIPDKPGSRLQKYRLAHGQESGNPACSTFAPHLQRQKKYSI